MTRRTVLTVSTAACLCGAYALYCLLVSPAVAPLSDVSYKRAESARQYPVRTPESQRQAEQHLGQLSWLADAKYQVQDDRTFVFADKWMEIEDPGGVEPKDSSSIRFQPFAMIWRQKNHSLEDEPITIVAQSAVVEFSGKFDVNRSPGRVIGGALEGDVTVRGPKGMSVVGRDFHFSETALRVWSDNPVRFAYGPNQGSGYGLELDLIKEPGRPSEDQPAIAGIRTIRLLKDVVMDLVSESKDTAAPREKVHVTSAGSFEYGFESHVATLQKDVRVRRPTGQNQFDTLDKCLTLTLVFEPQAAPQTAAATSPNAPSAADSPAFGGDLEFRLLRAEGPNTTVMSDRSSLQAHMQELTYDAQARVVAMRDAQQVRMLQRDNELRSPEVTARMDEDGQIIEATCRGKGQLFRYVGTPADASKPAGKRPVDFAGEWLEELRLEPDRRTGLDLIEFKGRSVLKQPGKMALQADIIRLWVTPDRDGQGAALGRESAAAANPAKNAERARPRRMLALSNVAFASPQITGETERLEIWFIDGKLPLPPALGRGDRPRKLGVTRPPRDMPDRAGVPAVRFVQMRPGPARHGGSRKNKVASRSGLADVADPAPVRKTAPPKKPPKQQPNQEPPRTERTREDNPLHIVAAVIKVKTMMDGDDPQVAEVLTEGSVHVTQDHGKQDRLPLDLQGDHLHLRNYSEPNHEVIDLRGSPAHIRDQGMHIEGADIHFDRGQNLAQVNGPGVLRFPVQRTFDGKPLAKPQSLDVFWKERMTFDGQRADFFAGVETKLEESKVRCQEMHVTLAERISFAEDADVSQDPPLKLIECRDGVELKSSQYEQNRLVEIREAKVFQVTFDQTTKNFTAHGPGVLEMWRRSGGQRAGLANTVGVRANRPLQADTSEWEYSRIDFAGRMDGNSDQSTTRFLDRVKIINGPVARPPDVIDPDELPLHGCWMRSESLDLTQHPAQGSQPAYLEVVGQGNTELEGRAEQGSFNAHAARVSYDQSKELFSLFGDGTRDATIWREQRIGGERDVMPGQRMDFIPSRNQVFIHKASGAQGGR